MAKKKIYNLFPVPIFQYKIENYQKINQELLNYILELQKKNKIGNTHSNRGGWHSPNFDLVNEGPPINFINKFKDFLKHIISSDMGWEYIRNKQRIVAMWAIINKKNSSKFDEAEKQLIQLIKVYSNDNSLLVLLADLYRTNKQYEKAIEFYTLLIKKQNISNDQLWRIYYMRGICYERSNKWRKAENDFLQALKTEPEQPQVLNYLAYGWIEKNYYLEKSIEMLEVAINKNPENHYILDSLAWAYYKKHNLSKASIIMEKAIEIAPGEAISLDHLGDIYFALGRKREAYFMWIQALDLAEPVDNISESVQMKLDKYNAR